MSLLEVLGEPLVLEIKFGSPAAKHVLIELPYLSGPVEACNFMFTFKTFTLSSD